MFGNSKILNGFFVFEGLDGAGTSTQLKLLEKSCLEKELPVKFTFEPTDNEIGNLIRRVLSGSVTIEKSSLARLFAADRNEHLNGKRGIRQYINEGNLVICDRYLFSSLAYQGLDIGTSEAFSFNSDFPLPEILFFFDIEPKTGEARYKKRSTLEIYEDIRIQERVRSEYEQLFEDLSETGVRIERIDSSKSIEEIFSQLWSIVASHPIVKM